MKKIISMLPLFISVGFSQQIIHTETWESGRIKFLSYHKKVDRGMGIELLKKEEYEYARKVGEENYKDGRKDGLYAKWYTNGQKKIEGTYKNGELDGLYTEWYENGQKKEEINYKNGNEDGLNTRWWENGQKWYENNFKNSRRISGKEWNKDGSVKE